MGFDLKKITRPNIWTIKPYSSARDEYSGSASIYLDANENPFNNGFNRYPDPYQWKLKEQIADIKNVKKEQILLGNGSDEVIDLLFRAFCEPGKDETIILPPTYGMYQVSADINNVKLTEVNLTTEEFDINLEAVLSAIKPNTKIIWLCSPNNPTGNSLNPESIKSILEAFEGVVVVDEAYIDYSMQESWINYLDYYPNLFVMQTFSKAWGLAGIRLGMGFASTDIISLLNKIKPPYNINSLTQEKALEEIEKLDDKNEKVDLVLTERAKLIDSLEEFDAVKKVYFSDANFVLIKIDQATNVYNQLTEKSIIVRNRSNVVLCDNCLRITVGTPEENKELIKALKELTA